MCQRGPNPYSSHTQNPQPGCQPRLPPLPQPNSSPFPQHYSPLARCSLQAPPYMVPSSEHPGPAGEIGREAEEGRGPVLRWGTGLGGGVLVSGSLTQASPQGSVPAAKGPQDVKGRFRKGPQKGLAGMVGKDLSWSEGCSRMKVRGWKQRDQGGCGPGRGGQALGKRGTPTQRPTDSALPAPEGPENFVAPPRPVSNPAEGRWGPGSGARTWGLGCPRSRPRRHARPPSLGTGRVGTECA